MSINGSPFLLFLLVTVLLYYLIPKRFRWLVLLGASVFFYLTWSVPAAGYLAGTALLTWGFSLALERLGTRRPEDSTAEEKQLAKKRLKRKKRQVLAAALVLNFLVLAVLKYSGFLVGNLNLVLSLLGSAEMPLPSFFLPLGISFYIFSTSGYLIDVYRGKCPAEKNFARYILFVCYFPQIIEGPINRYGAMAEQLYGGNDFSWDNIQYGLLRMLRGILKKVLVADALHRAVTTVYADHGSLPGVISLLGAVLYCVQLYCDFSGGIDLVMGASRLFGVQMQENFRQPYFASSLSDFWRRWHISLGEWMKDYLFYPLAISKSFGRMTKWAKKHLPPEAAKRLAPCVATVIVFLAVGIWQGPGWANIAYGLWNGVLMSLGMLWAPVSGRLYDKFQWKRGGRLMTAWGVVRTNLLVVIGRYFSGSASLRGALTMLWRTVAHPGFSGVDRALLSSLGLDLWTVCVTAAALAVLFFISRKDEHGDFFAWFADRKWYVQFLVLVVCLAVVVLGVYCNSEYTPIEYVYENI